ncbi:hypothetical protein AVEN_50716-1 [Araneus ventricosus]|uniref:Uncharacterized protein n=1 Tax=Araneus ventricosus TaxID=182803 RepID=A0A4Y2HZT0_ARAVE|nr:hypothetical protein AVEN_50716-1 [Araneus ventricosus]
MPENQPSCNISIDETTVHSQPRTRLMYHLHIIFNNSSPNESNNIHLPPKIRSVREFGALKSARVKISLLVVMGKLVGPTDPKEFQREGGTNMPEKHQKSRTFLVR